MKTALKECAMRWELRELMFSLLQAVWSLRFVTESCEETYCAGKADLKKVNITCVLENGSHTFPVYCTTPHKKPKTTFVLINFSDSVPDRYLPVDFKKINCEKPIKSAFRSALKRFEKLQSL